MNIKRYRIVWELYRFYNFLRRKHKPPFGTVGHNIQCGKWTREEAGIFLDKTNHHEYEPFTIGKMHFPGKKIVK